MVSEVDDEVAPAVGADAPDDDWMQMISRRVRQLSTGDRAALRRMELTRSPAAGAVVVKLLLGAKIPAGRYEADWDRWRLIGHFAGMLSGTAAVYPHDERRGVGGALFEAGFSEKRLLRLLASRGEALRDQLALAIRILARERKPINLWALYHLLGDDPGKSDAARLRITQQFFAAQARA